MSDRLRSRLMVSKMSRWKLFARRDHVFLLVVVHSSMCVLMIYQESSFYLVCKDKSFHFTVSRMLSILMFILPSAQNRLNEASPFEVNIWKKELDSSKYVRRHRVRKTENPGKNMSTPRRILDAKCHLL